MGTNGERVRKLITEEAAEWFVANRAGLAAKDRDAFGAWLQASPMHVEEYLALSVIAGDLRKACELPQGSLNELLDRARRQEDSPVQGRWPRLVAGVTGAGSHRWQMAAFAAAALGVLSVGLLALWNFGPAARAPAPGIAMALHFETRHGEQQTRRLADNSVLHLNTDSAVSIQYSNTERRVVLTSGEADFEVAHEPNRPFRVFAGSAEVTDIGTKFDVRLGQDSTVITVVEGRVAVGPSMLAGRSTDSNPDHPPRYVELSANQQLIVSAGEWLAGPVAVDAQRTTAWLHRQILFEREPLEQVASEFNRYAPKPIEITTPALLKLEISGVADTDDTAAFVAFLRSLEGVRVEETTTQIRVSAD